MNERNAKELAESFLLRTSSDEGWIDASSAYTVNKLTELLQKVYQDGVNSVKKEEDMKEACGNLGYLPGSFDE